jgi:hypothetical protein
VFSSWVLDCNVLNETSQSDRNVNKSVLLMGDMRRGEDSDKLQEERV